MVVPPFPKVLNLDAWKAATTTNVLAACADPHQEDWVRWLQEAYKPFPDIEKLNDSGGVRYNSPKFPQLRLLQQAVHHGLSAQPVW